MKVHGSEDVLYVLKRTGRVLNPNQRIVVMLYAAADQRPDGSVWIKATELAETAGMSAPVFSRTRKELEALGWLEEVDSVGPVKVFRLTPTVDAERDQPAARLRVVNS
ncbi:replication initiation protein, RepL2 [Streptomyces sp. ISL-43]|uniref:helix-turn-helix domain-containing protein n=1 Tax=Streptomyces sp. ISL-43 TaxID=2819183 RepID=UPI001BE73C1C|nr:helix-turn-helix domain-containing protein [Streptomyces sp. ISL-43]MBT2447931.1 replication initiation protein, RepL2 [Streptomyces sp. ISL-43]